MKAHIQQDGTQVVFFVEGNKAVRMPYQLAREVAKAILSKAALAEEVDKAEEIIAHDALLIRTGAPFAMTNNRKIREASYKEAQWGTPSRRGMPLLGAPSAKSCGTPRIIKSRG